MCQLERKLKLCTCGKIARSKLEHYWVLHRFDAEKNDRVLGRIAVPPELGRGVAEEHRALLLERLQEADAFDVDLAPREGDRLQLSFRFSATQWAKYGFAFRGGRWVEEEYCPLGWRWHHTEERFGAVKDAVKSG